MMISAWPKTILFGQDGAEAEMAGKPAFAKAESHRVFGQARKLPKMFRAGLYARVSTHDQKTLPMQN
jgi:hypothetical protein